MRSENAVMDSMNNIDGSLVGVGDAVARLDAITLDQLRTFLAVADTGTFSAAGRRLGRVQSAISHTIAALESQVGFALFDRSARLPVLTSQGRALLASARSVSLQVEALHQSAREMRAGTEPSVSLVVDAMFPTAKLVEVARGFQQRWPSVSFRLRVEALGAVLEELRRVKSGIAVASAYAEHNGVVSVALGSVEMVPVVAAAHPLATAQHGQAPAEAGEATRSRELSTAELGKHVQIVLSGRGEEESAPDRGVLSPRTWRVADMETRQALIRAGLGWGNLPIHRVEADLATGALVRLRPVAWVGRALNVGLLAAWLPEAPPGPAGRWLVEALGTG